MKLEIESLKELDFDLDLLGFNDLELDDLLGENIDIEEDEILDVEERKKWKEKVWFALVVSIKMLKRIS